ncbi:MAG: DUF504 domain-containing protein [Candidatus Heimdallarchaeota archaeon]|nr:MAG: DUF504 domain-containing protein [Candidatus Heimdallarchaeota archaeon]
MTKKGEIREWFSRIQHGPADPDDFSVVFRDFNDYIELSFEDFANRQREDSIPLHRISQIRKNGIPIYTRPSFCTRCGNPLQENNCLNPQCSRV